MTESIERMCENRNLECKVFSDKVFIKTGVAEWYFDLNETNNIRLFHNNYLRKSKSNKFGSSYHVQKRKFHSHEEIINYIDEHDKQKFKTGIKPCRMEYLFAKIETRRVTA